MDAWVVCPLNRATFKLQPESNRFFILKWSQIYDGVQIIYLIQQSVYIWIKRNGQTWSVRSLHADWMKFNVQCVAAKVASIHCSSTNIQASVITSPTLFNFCWMNKTKNRKTIAIKYSIDRTICIAIHLEWVLPFNSIRKYEQQPNGK